MGYQTRCLVHIQRQNISKGFIVNFLNAFNVELENDCKIISDMVIF